MADARFLHVAGKRSNFLARALLTSSSVDANYGLTRLSDGDAGSPFRFATAGVNDYISADLDQVNSLGVRGGGFEGATLAADGWTATQNGASNLASEDAAQHYAGSKSCKLHVATAGAGTYAAATETLTEIPSGEYRTTIPALRGDGTVYARVRIYCPDTAQYLKYSGGVYVWDTARAAAVDVATNATAAWVATTISFRMPTYAQSGMSLLSLQLIAIGTEASNTGDAWVDEFRCWPNVDFLGIYGQNFCGVIPSWKASATGAFAGEEVTLATLTVSENTFYSALATRSAYRFHRLVLTGTNADSRAGGPMAWIGSMTLSQAYVLVDAPLLPMEMDIWLEIARIRLKGVTLHWKWSSATNMLEFEQEFVARADRWPVWIVPRDDEAAVVFGRVQAQYKIPRISVDIWDDTTVVITPQPFPVWT